MRVALLVCLLLTLLAPARALGHEAPDHTDAPHELEGVDLAQAVAVARAQAGASSGDGLPETWCGSPTTRDDVANAAVAPSRPQIKLIYAYAADQPNRFAAWQDDLQTTVALIQRFLSAQTGGRKALRVDTGTSCGGRYVDVMMLPLAGPRASYAGDFHAVVDEAWARLGATAGPRDLVILGDGLAPGNATYGEAQIDPTADEPGAGNRHNRGGLASVLWARQGAEPGDEAWWPEGHLHEITHMLGAVQRSAPHRTPYGHCFDGADLMCYQDGPGAPATQTVCAPDPRAIFQAYDCGRDDYFNPAPAAGSYLATHWNVYDSAFLAGCDELAGACGGGEAPRAAPRPPVSTELPKVHGTPEVGATLAASSGAWLNEPDEWEYRWQRARAGGDWRDVPGADGQTYTVVSEDVGAALRIVVRVANDDGEAVAESPGTAAVPAPPVTATVAPAVLTAPAAPAVHGRGPRVARTALRAGRRTLGWVRFSLAHGAVHATPERVRLAAGRYTARACVRTDDGTQRCARRTLHVRKRARVALPVLRVVPEFGGPLRVGYRLSGRKLAARGDGVALGP